MINNEVKVLDSDDVDPTIDPDDDLAVDSGVDIDSDDHNGADEASSASQSESSRAPAVWAVGAHGGAGVTTLARMLAPFGDAGTSFPHDEDSLMCVIVARSTLSGVERAHAAVLEATRGSAGECDVLGIIVIKDVPGKIPKVVRQRLHVIKQITPIWTVDFLPELRTIGEDDILAQWSPLQSHSESKKRRWRKQKKLSVTDRVPDQIVQIAQEVFLLAKQIYKSKKEHDSDI